MIRFFHQVSIHLLRQFLLVMLAGIGSLLLAPAPLLAETGEIPAPIPGAIIPTIQITPGSGYAGQPVTVSGQGVAPYPGVRIAWVANDATQTAVVVERQPSNAYSATIAVPADVAAGAVQVCAAVTGTAQAEFTCTNFTITVPPPGEVTGQLPGVTARTAAASAPLAPCSTDIPITADFNLIDKYGEIVRSTLIQSDGAFAITNMPPGNFRAVISGLVPKPVQSFNVYVPPSQKVIATLTDLVCEEVTVAAVRATPSGGHLGPTTFGTYIHLDTPVEVRFIADLQIHEVGISIDRVEFHLKRPGDTAFTTIGNGFPVLTRKATYELLYNVSQLPVGHTLLRVVAMVNGRPYRSQHHSIQVIDDPMKDPLIQPGGQTKWNAATRRYEFNGTMPNLGGALPLIYPNPPWEVFGKRLENKVGLGLEIRGSLALNGEMQLSLLKAQALAQILGIKIYDKSETFPPIGLVTPGDSDIRRIGASFGPYRFTPIPYQKIPIYHGLVAVTPYGTVWASIEAGLQGDMILNGTIRPLVPALEGTLMPALTLSAIGSMWFELLIPIVAVGGDIKSILTVGLPLQVNTESAPPISLAGVCVAIRFDLASWVRIGTRIQTEWPVKVDIDLSKRIDLFTIRLYENQTGECPPGTLPLAAAQRTTTSPPRVMAAPVVASGPNGEALAAYIEDTTANIPTSTRKVMTRFWDVQANAWGDAVPVTDGSHVVFDPAVVFAGPNATPIVAWTEKVMPSDEEQATEALADHLRRFEIFVAVWNGTAWSSPLRLTNDNLPAGRPVLGGDELAATLAWVQDIDGDMTTRLGTRIATTSWNPTTGVWGPIDLLNGAQTDAMNAQVSIAHAYGEPKLVWTVDEDGNPSTNADRRLALATLGQTDWVITRPAELPVGAESPSLVIDGEGNRQLAFIVRSKDADGRDIGIGNLGQLWTATFSPNEGYLIKPLLDNEQPVRAERPQLSVGPGNELLLLFRRFGDTSATTAIGQLAFSQHNASTGNFTPPLYLTDDVRQRWQPALAVSQVTGKAFILGVSRAVDGAVAPSDGAIAAATSGAVQHAQTLLANDDPVESLIFEPGSDPALDPALQLSQPHAAPGSTVTVSATLRNLGRTPISNVQVAFYQGAPGAGTLMTIAPFSETLEFNIAHTVSVAMVVGNGQQPIYAEVTGGESNLSNTNDRASADLGALPSPSAVSTIASVQATNALEVGWTPSAASAVAGYRILRSKTSTGPYELVGEALGTSYQDRLLVRGQTYFYVVQAYDSAGTVSSYSREASGSLPLHQVYLPLTIH